jgi:hypothetical protein
MIRRLSIVVAGALVAGFLAAGTATAAPADDSPNLSPKEQAGLHLANDVLDRLLGSSIASGV